MSIQNERRQQDRFSSTLGISINAINQDGSDFAETTHLRDISGGGLSFLTRKPQHYDFGQSVDITLFLSEQSDGKGFGVGIGKVMWINDPSTDSSGWIGVMLNDLMNIKHINEKIGISIGHTF